MLQYHKFFHGFEKAEPRTGWRVVIGFLAAVTLGSAFADRASAQVLDLFRGPGYKPVLHAQGECDTRVRRGTIILVDHSYLTNRDQGLVTALIEQGMFTPSIISDSSMIPGEGFALLLFDGTAERPTISTAVQGCWMTSVSTNPPTGRDPVRYAQLVREAFASDMRRLFSVGLSRLGATSARAQGTSRDWSLRVLNSALRHFNVAGRELRVFYLGNPFAAPDGTPITTEEQLAGVGPITNLAVNRVSLSVFGYEGNPSVSGLSQGNVSSMRTIWRNHIARQGGWVVQFQNEMDPTYYQTNVAGSRNQHLVFEGVFGSVIDEDLEKSAEFAFSGILRNNSELAGVDWISLRGESSWVSLPVDGRMICDDRSCSYTGAVKYVPARYQALFPVGSIIQGHFDPGGGAHGVVQAPSNGGAVAGEALYHFYAIP